MPNQQIPLNCPHCGRAMRLIDMAGHQESREIDSSAASGVYLCECPVHGRFHLGPGRDLTPGMPDT